ncbi:MAG: hypothetical protein IPL95_10500 [Saprospiraceae bacterium]|nr:hypothetical protein [Saprospiraceae bacterium]
MPTTFKFLILDNKNITGDWDDFLLIHLLNHLKMKSNIFKKFFFVLLYIAIAQIYSFSQPLLCDTLNETETLIKFIGIENTNCGERTICFEVGQCHYTDYWKLAITLPANVIVTNPGILNYDQATNKLTYESKEDIVNSKQFCFNIGYTTSNFYLYLFARHVSTGPTFRDYDCKFIEDSPVQINGNVNLSNSSILTLL